MPKFYGVSNNFSKKGKFWSKFFGMYAIALMLLIDIPYTIYSILLRKSFGEWILISLIFGLILLVLYIIYKNCLYSALKFRKGINGEECVYYELHKLPNGYSVFQDVQIPNRIDNIDFVVLGPTGIFSIEVKNVKGLISFDGKNLLADNKLLENKDVIQQVRDQYWGLHNHLQEKIGNNFVTPIVVFKKNYFQKEFGFDPVIEQIRVIHGKQLVNFIVNLPKQTFSNDLSPFEEQIRLMCRSTY
jgi:hypothetical protein